MFKFSAQVVEDVDFRLETTCHLTRRKAFATCWQPPLMVEGLNPWTLSAESVAKPLMLFIGAPYLQLPW